MAQESTSVRAVQPDVVVDAVWSRRFRSGSIAAAMAVLLFAIADIVGWAFDVDMLKHPFGTLPSLQSGTSITLLFAAVPLLLLTWSRSSAARLIARVTGAVVLTVGGLNLGEHLSGHDWNLAYPIFTPPNGLPLSFPGPMAPDVAFACVFFGLSLLLVDVTVRGRLYPFQWLAIGVALPNIMILCSYAAGMPHMCAYFGCVRFSPITSLALTLASLSLVFSQVEIGITNIFARTTTGGRIIRLSSAALLALIPLLWLVKLGETSGLYDATASGGISSLLVICLLGGCIAWGARKVDSMEAEKTQAVELLKGSILEFAPQQPKSMKGVCLVCGREFDDLSLERCPDDGTELSKIADRLKIGSIFAERYEILSLLGSGGISTVYLARHLHMEKRVAVKLLHANFATETKYVQRFQREAQAASKLNHPYIVGVHDFGISLDGQAYLVMEYLEGKSLDEIIQEQGAIPWHQAVPIFMQICEGLAEAHGANVIHRDMKPANVMLLNEPGRELLVKIVDFGLARDLSQDAKLTATGDVLGSPTYMSPEQCRSDPVDARSDIYSTGAMMYDCLAGHPAIQSDNIYETISLQLTAPPPPFSSDIYVPDWLASIIFQCLEKDPWNRPQSAVDLLRSLQAGLRGQVFVD
ncbi:MAG TPA: serine/threonine-protein kinase [Planktothrix sp.]|jgi:serine/threonine-protein kinase